MPDGRQTVPWITLRRLKKSSPDSLFGAAVYFRKLFDLSAYDLRLFFGIYGMPHVFRALHYDGLAYDKYLTGAEKLTVSPYDKTGDNWYGHFGCQQCGAGLEFFHSSVL